MDIQFKTPFDFQLEILETDDHIPSLYADVHIIIEQFRHKCQYNGTFWIECAVWNSFLQALHHPTKEIASLYDISENFVLSVLQVEQGIELQWKFSKIDIGGKRKIVSNFMSLIDEDTLVIIRRAFEECPTWW